MQIKAFKGYRYDSQVVGEIGPCVTPPYDVIDERMQARFYDQSPYSVVRIIKGRTEPDDNDQENQYTRAGEFFEHLVHAGALKADSADSLYGYVQNFTLAGETFERSGFVALGKLEPFGKNIKPHEKTLDGPKADRLNLMRATAGQFGQVFMIYDDPDMVADAVVKDAAGQPPLVDFTDDENVRHRLFAVSEPDKIQAVANMMDTRHAVIADGHHRYETALNYYNETQNPEAEYRMMTFVNMRNPGMIILPTHRLVSNLPEFNADKLLENIKKCFEITHYTFSDAAEKETACTQLFADMKADFDQGKHSFGLYAGDNSFHRMVLKYPECMATVCPDLSEASRSLDVTILHKAILERQLNIGDAALAAESNLTYIKDIGQAVKNSIETVDQGRAQAIFLMNPTRMQQVQDVAAAGEKMPQKSTFFYPKIFTGLVINKLSPATVSAQS